MPVTFPCILALSDIQRLGLDTRGYTFTDITDFDDAEPVYVVDKRPAQPPTARILTKESDHAPA